MNINRALRQSGCKLLGQFYSVERSTTDQHACLLEMLQPPPRIVSTTNSRSASVHKDDPRVDVQRTVTPRMRRNHHEPVFRVRA